MTEVFQRNELATFFSREEMFEDLKLSDYTKVAEVETDDLDTAYELTNNISDLWIKNDKVTASKEVREKGGCRSTSVGDIMKVNGNFFIVDNFGFVSLSVEITGGTENIIVFRECRQ